VTRLVSVAIPVLNGAGVLDRTLDAVRAQELASSAAVEIVVCDSGSRDASVKVARRHGAEVVEIAPHTFSHGETRNLLMQSTQADHVAFLTQDSVPANGRWLDRLLEGFSLAPDVGLVFGPYLPRDDATPMVARELDDWFHSFSPDGAPTIDRMAPLERSAPARVLLGPRGFFTDANGCVARAAWETVPFRAVPYAEDHVLAHDMLRAGYAKVFLPEAAVIHSHDYSGIDWLRRSFDEARALQGVYGFAQPLDPRRQLLNVWGRVGADLRWMAARHGHMSAGLAVRSATHHSLRIVGALLGGRAAALPERVVRRLSLEGRAW
jgi:glycosyltransferase involved in cell wall biosynthesis